MSKIFMTIIWVLLFANQIIAQPDGTINSSDFIQEILKNIDGESKTEFDISSVNLSENIPLELHIVLDPNGKAGVSNVMLVNTIEQVNMLFKPLNMTYNIDTIEIVNDYNYSNLKKDDRNMTELLKKHAVSNKINVFYVDTLSIDSLKYYGFTYFPTDKGKNYIFLTKAYSDGNSLATMLGHYMGLLSTHDQLAGQELVNGSNCNKAGDLICDTYADPNVFGNVDEKCDFSGIAKDSKGFDYVPSVSNIMSNSLPNCKCLFTNDQYKRMYYYYKKYRQNTK
jgi:hypothetical protein